MNIFDFIVLLVFIVFVLRGVWKGLVGQIVSLVSLYVCWFVASRFAFAVAPLMPVEAPWNHVGAIVVLFIATLIGIRFAHHWLQKGLQWLKLKKYDRFLGGTIGFIEAALICVVVTFFGVLLSETVREAIFVSKTGPYLMSFILKIDAIIPTQSHELVKREFDRFRQATAAIPNKTNGQSEEEPLIVGEETMTPQEKSNNAVSFLDGLSKWWNKTSQASVTPSTTGAVSISSTAASTVINQLISPASTTVTNAVVTNFVNTLTGSTDSAVTSVANSVNGTIKETVNRVANDFVTNTVSINPTNEVNSIAVPPEPKTVVASTMSARRFIATRPRGTSTIEPKANTPTVVTQPASSSFEAESLFFERRQTTPSVATASPPVTSPFVPPPVAISQPQNVSLHISSEYLIQPLEQPVKQATRYKVP